MAMLSKAIDNVRADEAKRMAREGYEPILKHSRWYLLKRLTGYGFRTSEATQIALYHSLGELPEPKGTHEFF